jgi:hypothetical protein
MFFNTINLGAFCVKHASQEKNSVTDPDFSFCLKNAESISKFHHVFEVNVTPLLCTPMAKGTPCEHSVAVPIGRQGLHRRLRLLTITYLD